MTYSYKIVKMTYSLNSAGFSMGWRAAVSLKLKLLRVIKSGCIKNK
ncbi:hypothetical protein SAMN04488121_109163 [Chitinophaga filiformis]|uniref:Uncharacterized protein n=1 Tax=Chitinophaga filiformis TaxID=104663 RepID=A0A1G8A8G3_CHIFI|nr:hypothetical protein SAMN04488121_109163 [Chitinophaga filiformis]